MNSALDLAAIARTIWQAGVDAVGSERLVANSVHCDGQRLSISGHLFDLAELDRLVVLGAGKAGAGMAAAIEQSLGEKLVREKVTGWVNVPGDCVRPLQKIVLHGARPAGVNEPTEAGVFGTERILELARSLGPRDLGIVLISGGGSALLPAPIPAISLADKQAITRWLMRSGASITELNAVRKRLSRIKGGGLARVAAGAKSLVTLIISDVIGDPLDVIASGPTVPDSSTPADAMAVLKRYRTNPPPDVDAAIARAVAAIESSVAESVSRSATQPQSSVFNHVIGHNATALNAAAAKARELGFAVTSLGSDNAGEARTVGRDLAELCARLRGGTGDVTSPSCVLSGGEPVVHLAATDQPRRGGRNQEVALAALQQLWNTGLDRIAILSGGTDGEDGPTDAAGAVVDEPLRQRALAQTLNPASFLAINNSYPFFEATGGLLRTGPTHTNVMDLRVAVIAAEPNADSSPELS